MPKVLISDKLSPAAVQIFKDAGIEVDVNTGLTPDELKKIIGQYDGLAIRSNTKVTADVLALATNLKVVARAGIGVDNVDIPAATASGVVVMNTPFGNSVTTAEHAIALMFSIARDIPVANSSTQNGKWEKSRFMGAELTSKTLGIIGCGNIGAIVADRALGLRMRVIAFDPFLSIERAADLGIEKVELDTLLSRADFITLHTPLTDATRNVINKAALAKMKKGVRIINCARGGLIVEEDLKAAIESGHVAGAALDVFKTEPAKENILFGMEKIIATPHLGASTSEAQENVALQVAEQMSDFLLTGAVTNALNMPSVSAEEAPKLRPYMVLAGQLGSFAGQLRENALKEVQIEYSGHVASLNTRPLTAIILEGLLKPMVESVNMVNAPVLAKERDIKVLETTNQSEDNYNTLIRITTISEKVTRTVAGTLFGGSKPRLVEINGIPIEVELGPHMLSIVNQDKPGFIGSLGTVLGNHGINIATFHLGRKAVGGNAILLAQVDQPLGNDILNEIRNLPQVLNAKCLAF